jgi:hypothetical protein
MISYTTTCIYDVNQMFHLNGQKKEEKKVKQVGTYSLPIGILRAI